MAEKRPREEEGEDEDIFQSIKDVLEKRDRKIAELTRRLEETGKRADERDIDVEFLEAEVMKQKNINAKLSDKTARKLYLSEREKKLINENDRLQSQLAEKDDQIAQLSTTNKRQTQTIEVLQTTAGMFLHIHEHTKKLVARVEKLNSTGAADIKDAHDHYHRLSKTNCGK